MRCRASTALWNCRTQTERVAAGTPLYYWLNWQFVAVGSLRWPCPHLSHSFRERQIWRDTWDLLATAGLDNSDSRKLAIAPMELFAKASQRIARMPLRVSWWECEFVSKHVQCALRFHERKPDARAKWRNFTRLSDIDPAWWKFRSHVISRGPANHGTPREHRGMWVMCISEDNIRTVTAAGTLWRC